MRINYRRLAFVLLTSVSATTMIASCANAGNAGSTKARDGHDAKARADEIISKVDIPYEMFTLDNGLTVIVHPDETVSSVYVGVNYLVGSKDEPPGKSGFAHLFEHLMFQKTENRKTPYAEALQDAGALTLNGYTTPDQTTYYDVVPAAGLDAALWLESDRMMHLLGAIDETALKNQRGVVQNEKREGEADIRGRVEEAYLKALYPVGHPYHHSTIGSMEDLDNASLEDVKDWFRQYYGASNAVLLISGKVDVATAKEKAKKYFGAAPAGMALSKVETRIPELGENKKDVLYDATSTQTKISYVWPLPPSGERDITLMDLAASTLAGSENSPLHRKLIDESELATDVSVYVQGGKLTSTLWLDATLAPGANLDELRDGIEQAISEYLKAGPEQKLLDAAKLNDNIQFFNYASSPGAGSVVEDAYLTTGDPEHYKKEMAWENKATAADVKSAAQKWMAKPRVELTILPFPEYKSAAKDVDRSAVPSTQIEKKDPTWPALETSTLDNGITLNVMKKGDVPMEHVTILMDGAGAYSDGRKVGAADLAIELMIKGGAGDRTPTEVTDALASVGADVSANNQGGFSDLNFSVLEPYFGDMFSIVGDMLMRPRFSESELEKQKTIFATNSEDLKADPTGSVEMVVASALYGAGSVNAVIPTPENYTQLTRDDIAEFYQREVSPERITIIAVGGMDPEVVKSQINKALGKWRGNGAASQKKMPAALLPPKKRVILIDKPDAQQSEIFAANALPVRFDPETNATLDLANTMLGGDFLARLNMNLREAKGWSYGVGSTMYDIIGGSQIFVVSGNFQTDKTTESMKEIQREIREFVTSNPPTKEEFEKFKDATLRASSVGFDDAYGYLGSMIRSWSRDVPLDEGSRVVARLQKPTLQDVNAMAQKVLKPDQLTWVVVGDLKKIEGPIRSLGYGDVEVWDGFGNRLR